MKLYKTVFLLTFMTSLLAGCAAPRTYNTVPLDATTSAAASSFSTQPGMAKVYFVGGTQGFGAFTDPQIWGGEFFINGTAVGQINQNEVLALDVVPNTYTFTFQPANNTDATREPLTKMLAAGNVVILRGDLKMGRLALLLGPLAASSVASITEVTDNNIISGRTFVKATSCPATICPLGDSNIGSTNLTPASNASTSQTKTSNSLKQAEATCRELGFTKGTEKYADCVMKISK